MDEGYDAVNIARALDLAAGRALDPLPPEAFALDAAAPGRARDDDAERSAEPAPIRRGRRGVDHGSGRRTLASLTGVTPDRRSVAGVPARELAGLAGILALAAILRFIALPTRGRWDADQGHDMLTLLELTQRGIVPLLGPPTSIGDFHHGVLYYYLLAPAAWLSGSDPVAVTGDDRARRDRGRRGHLVAGAVDRRAGRGRSSPAC